MITLEPFKGGGRPKIKPRLNTPYITSISYTEPGATYRRPIIRGRILESDTTVTLRFETRWNTSTKVTASAIVNGCDWIYQSPVDMNPGHSWIFVFSEKSGYSRSYETNKPFFILAEATNVPSISLNKHKRLINLPAGKRGNRNKEAPIYKAEKYEVMSIYWYTTNSYLIKINGVEYDPFNGSCSWSAQSLSAGKHSKSIKIDAIGPMGTITEIFNFDIINYSGPGQRFR